MSNHKLIEFGSKTVVAFIFSWILLHLWIY